MKRTAVVLLAILLAFAFCGCKKETENENNVSYEEQVYSLDTLLADGSLPEVPYKLGTSVEQIKKDAGYNPDEEGHGADEKLIIVENTNYVRMAYLTSYFCYEPLNVDKGISSIVDFGAPFGLEVGTATPDEVRQYFDNIEFEERELTTRQVYFIPMEMNNCSALTYRKDNRRIDFIFESDVLIAVNLVDTDNWSIIK